MRPVRRSADVVDGYSSIGIVSSERLGRSAVPVTARCCRWKDSTGSANVPVCVHSAPTTDVFIRPRGITVRFTRAPILPYFVLTADVSDCLFYLFIYYLFSFSIIVCMCLFLLHISMICDTVCCLNGEINIDQLPIYSRAFCDTPRICEECGVTLQPIPEFPLRHSSKFNKIKIHTHTHFIYLQTLFTLFLHTLFL